MSVRKHVINPEITVLMQHIGANQDRSAMAIRSFLDQDYKKAKLVIMNVHPEPLRIKNIPQDAKIEIHNVNDVFTRPAQQVFHIVTLCDTDCWTSLDDDDWIEADHLSQLVEYWNECSDRSEKPLQVCSLPVTAHYESGPKVIEYKGWHQSLFERLSGEEVQLVSKNFPKEMYSGADTWISTNTFYDKRHYKGRPTYHWERRGDMHVSHWETIDKNTPDGAFKIALNYWRIKMECRLSPLKEIVL